MNDDFNPESDCGGHPCVFDLGALVYTSHDHKGTMMRVYVGEWADIGPFKHRINSIKTFGGYRMIYYPQSNFMGTPKDIQAGQSIPHFEDKIASIKFVKG